MSAQAFSNSSGASPETVEREKDAQTGLHLDVLKSLADKRTARDANPPKRRGPKPDSKPALTRRQELNRQAQRTHRERKEMYIKALEDEVLRLKEVYTTVSQAQDHLAHENRQLREMLRQHGIAYPMNTLMDDVAASGVAGSVSGYSQSSGTQNPLTPGLTSQSTAPSIASPSQPIEQQRRPMTRFQPCTATLGTPPMTDRVGVDSEQAGIDFVLTAITNAGEPCGHALMATYPPQHFDQLTPDIPFGHSGAGVGDQPSPPQTWELDKTGLAVLMDLSNKLNLDGEITPVMAWSMVVNHERFPELRQSDFTRIAEELSQKVRCYGFGAVMEEFEVRDAIEGVLSAHG